MRKKHPKRLFAVMVGMAFSANMIITAGAVEMTPTLPSTQVSAATVLDPVTSAPETQTGFGAAMPPPQMSSRVLQLPLISKTNPPHQAVRLPRILRMIPRSVIPLSLNLLR